VGGEQVRLSQIEKKVLEKLFLDRFIGGRHTSVSNVPKGFPKHLRGEVKKALKKLSKRGYLIVKPTGYGLEVSLKPDKIKEVWSILEEQ
jgi:hypothetical protein